MPVQKMLKQLFLLFSVLQLTVRGYDPSLVKNFTNPPNEGSDLTYQLGSRVVLTWQTDLDRVTLQLWDWSGKDSVDLREFFARPMCVRLITILTKLCQRMLPTSQTQIAMIGLLGVPQI